MPGCKTVTLTSISRAHRIWRQTEFWVNHLEKQMISKMKYEIARVLDVDPAIFLGT